MSKLTFSTIPDVCLLLVFDKIPLNDLLRHVNLVNRHWNTISGVACQNRKRLVLSLLHKSDQTKAFDLIIESFYTDPFEVSRCQSRYFGGEHEALIVPEARKRLNRQFIERLIERLPNIDTLEVNLRKLDISASEHLATLITGWREHLITLKLFTYYSGDRNQSLLEGLAQLTNLHTTINSLPVLHHLTYQLDFPFNDQNHEQNRALTFPITCPSLKELYFTSTDFQVIFEFANAFRDYVQSEEAVGLSKVACYIHRFYELYEYLSTSDVLASKTTHIALDFLIHIDETELMNFSRKFYNLTHVSHSISFDFPIDKLSKCLSILENLKHITLEYFDSMGYEDFEKAWLEDENFDRSRFKPWTTHIIPLVRIKSVHLDLNNIRWHQYLADHLCLNLTFPNLELISIETSDYACVHCGGHFNSDERETSRKFEWHECLGQFLEPIAKCDKLKRIEYWDDSDLTIDCSLEDFKLAWAKFID